MVMPWMVNIAALRCPDVPALTAKKQAKFDHLVQVWEKYVSPFEPANGDFEDWVEQAARLSAAVNKFGDGTIIRVVTNSTTTYKLVPTAEVTEKPDLHHRWGVVGRFEPCTGPEQEQAHIIDNYHASPTFQKHAGRNIRIVGSDDNELLDTILATAEETDEGVRVKCTHQKYAPVQLVTLEEIAALKAGTPLNSILHESLLWSAVHYEGQEDLFMVYPNAEMQYEYRIFMVNGTPATGAGAVEHQTPLDNEALFDLKGQQYRSVTDVVDCPHVENYIEFARKIGTALVKEGFYDYVLDVAWDGNGPLIVEMNSLSNSGLYAIDVDALAAALEVEARLAR